MSSVPALEFHFSCLNIRGSCGEERCVGGGPRSWAMTERLMAGMSRLHGDKVREASEGD